MPGDRRDAGVSLVAALLLAAVMPDSLEASSLMAVDACVNAISANGIDESRLIDAGWQRISRDERNERYHSFTSLLVSGVVILAPPPPNGLVCGVLSKRAYAPLVSALATHLGKPQVKIAQITMWAVGVTRVLVNTGSSKFIKDRVVSVSYEKEGGNEHPR